MTFAGLWTEADDHGRGVADPRILKGALWPLDDDLDWQDVEKHLIQLEETGHLRFYDQAGDRYFEIVNWQEHQSAAYRRGEAKHPVPDTSRDDPALPGVQDARQDVLEGKGRERKGRDARVDALLDTEFDELWKVYPRKLAKKDARAAYNTSVKGGASPAELFRAVKNYATMMDREERAQHHILHGATFFGPNERWKDYLEAPPPEKKKGDKSTRTLEDGTVQRFYEGSGWM